MILGTFVYRKHLIIGGFQRLIGDYSTTDHSYFADYATWCVKAATKTPSWKNIFFIFSTTLWIATISVFIIMFASIYIYSYVNDKKSKLFWSLACAIKINIGFNPGCFPQNTLGRFYFFMFLIYGLIVSTLFQSATVGSMTSHYYQTQISSLREAFENNFTFAGSNLTFMKLASRKDVVFHFIQYLRNFFSNYFQFFSYFSFLQNFEQMSDKFRLCPTLTACLHELKDNPQLVVIMPYKYVHYYSDIDHSKIYCSSQNIFNYHFSLVSRYGYHLMPKINNLILRFSEVGLLQYYRIFQIYEKGLINTNSSKYTSIQINKQTSFDLKREQSDHIVSLNTEHLGGAIFILIFGYSIAIAIFILEIIVGIFAKKKRNSQ